MRVSLLNRCVAEATGTFALVFAGTGAIIVNDVSGGLVTHPGIAMVFGLIVMAVIYALGDVSGAHINPAVTLAFWSAGRFPARQIAPYIFSQCAGGLLASLALLLMFPGHSGYGITLPAGGAPQSFAMEFILSFLLMFVIINVATGAQEKGVMAGAAIGAVVGLEAMFGGPVSGASMNPARSLAPALVAGEPRYLWLYLLAPVLGMLAAVFCCRWVRGPDCCTPEPEET